MRLGIGGKFTGWRADPASTGGGLLFDAGVHRFYMARALCGEVREIAAMADAPRERGEDLAVVLLRFESGALGVIEANYHCPPGAFDDAIEICASAGMLYLSGCEADFEGFRTGPALRRYDGAWHEEHVAPGGWEESVHASVQAFARALVQGAPPPVDGREGRAVVELIERVYALTGATRERVRPPAGMWPPPRRMQPAPVGMQLRRRLCRGQADHDRGGAMSDVGFEELTVPLGGGLSPIGHQRGLSAQAREELRSAIVEGRLPAGSLTSVRALSQALGISRTPVREALVDLAQEGLVTFERSRGVRVNDSKGHDILEIFQLRRMVEIPAMREAVLRFTVARRARARARAGGDARAPRRRAHVHAPRPRLSPRAAGGARQRAPDRDR